MDKAVKTRFPGIYKLGDGYRVRAYGTDQKTGKLKEVDRVLRGATLDEAIRLQADLRQEIAHGGDESAAPRTTLTAYAQSWIERRSEHYRLGTLRQKVLSLERHILPYLGDIFLDKLTQGDIERWMLALRKARNAWRKEYSPGTVNVAWRTLRTILRDAVVEVGLARDPTVRVRALPTSPPDPTDPNVLMPTEIPRFLDEVRRLSPQHYAFTFLGLMTGMRFGELSALTWEDVDEAAGVVRVTKSQNRGVVTPPKTGVMRTIPLTGEMARVLREHRRILVSRQHPGVDTGLVFPSETGGYRYPSLLTKPFARACRKTGISRRFTPHGMRRTFNTLMLRAGVDHVVLRATIGHSSEAMTEHYAHVSMDAKREGVERLMALLGVSGKADG